MFQPALRKLAHAAWPIAASLTLSSAMAQSSVPAPIAADLAQRSHDVRWPQGYAPADAQLFAHNDVLINASCDAVWTHLSAAVTWPSWYSNAKDVRLDDASPSLKADSHFSWSTFGLPIRSSIFELEPGRRLAWFGHGPGMHAYHTWLLTPENGRCKVITEEVTNGPAAAAWRAQNPGALHDGHDVWLSSLKRVVEQR